MWGVLVILDQMWVLLINPTQCGYSLSSLTSHGFSLSSWIWCYALNSSLECYNGDLCLSSSSESSQCLDICWCIEDMTLVMLWIAYIISSNIHLGMDPWIEVGLLLLSNLYLSPYAPCVSPSSLEALPYDGSFIHDHLSSSWWLSLLAPQISFSS